MMESFFWGKVRDLRTLTGLWPSGGVVAHERPIESFEGNLLP